MLQMPVFIVTLEVFKVCVDIDCLQMILAACHWRFSSGLFLTHAVFKNTLISLLLFSLPVYLLCFWKALRPVKS